MTGFYLIRHGEKADNITNNQGVSPLGSRQAQATAACLQARPITRVYTSPLRRASETADIIASVLAVPLIEDARLRERMNWGDIAGQSFEEFVALWRRCDADRDFAPPNGLSARQTGERVADFMRETQRQHPHDEVAVVTHGGAIADFLRNHFSQDELINVNPAWATLKDNIFANGSITAVRYESGRFVVQELAVNPQ